MVRIFLKFASVLFISSSLNATVYLQIGNREKLQVSKLKVVELPATNFAIGATIAKRRFGFMSKKYDIYFVGAAKAEIEALVARCKKHLQGGEEVIIFADGETVRIVGDLALSELPATPYLGLRITEGGESVEIK